MEKVKKKIQFTEGKVFVKILLFILPIVATNLLQAFYNSADMMVVSLSPDGADAVGAIGTTNSFIHLVVNVFIGFSVGANVVVAREIGAKNRDGAQRAVHTALWMAVIFGVGGMALGLALTKPVLVAVGNSGNLLTLSVRYTVLYMLGVPFLALTNFLMAIFRAKGDAKTPLVVLMLAGLLNVIMNFFFVVVCDMSVEGVAIATALSNVASTVVLLVKLQRDQDDTTFSFRSLKIDKASFGAIVRNGLPAGIQGALFSLSNIFIQSSIVRMDNLLKPTGTQATPVVNGNAAATNLENFIFTAMNAVYQGAITFTSQNVGAKKMNRVKPIMYSALAIVVAIGMSLSGAVYLLKRPLLGLYGVKEGVEGSLDYLAWSTALTRFRYICLVYFTCGSMDVFSGVLRGLGKSITSMVISLIGACLLRLVWIWLVFPRYLTLDSIFVSYPISWVLTLAVEFIVIQAVLRKYSKNKRIEETESA